MRLWETRNHKNAQYSKNERKYTNNLTKKKKKRKGTLLVAIFSRWTIFYSSGFQFFLKRGVETTASIRKEGADT